MVEEGVVDALPDTFGERYVAIVPIGTGATATVLRARDTALERDVAIKLPLPQYARDDAFVRRFAREATAAARLVHANVAVVFDVGRSHAGPYVVMEYVSGGSLRDVLLARGALAEGAAIALGRALAAALAAAHEAGILHRDVKPANVLLARDGTPKLADFGLARPQASGGDDRDASGTPGFRAPETLRGEAATVASDLYALGATLFVATAGRLPSATLGGPRESVPGSAPFAAIVDQLVRDDPRERYASARDVVAAFDALEARSTHVIDAAFERSPDARDVDARVLDAPTLVADASPSPPPPMPKTPSGRRASRGVAGAPILVLAVALAVALAVGASLAVRNVASRLASHPMPTVHRRASVERLVLPDVVGLPFAAARARLDRVRIRSTTYPTPSSAAAGTIVDERPVAGTHVRPGTRVTLRLSIGPPAGDGGDGGDGGEN